MKMAGHRHLVPPIQGLLLCISALHLCVQDPRATAEHNAVTSTTSLAMATSTSNALVATNKTSASTATAASKTRATAANKALVAANKTSVAMAAAAKISVASAATNKALAITANKVTVATNKAMATTKAAATTTANKASGATAAAANNASVDDNKALVAPTTAAAAKAALVAVAAATSKASVDTNKSLVAMAAATNNASVDTNKSSVATAAASEASLAANVSVNGTEETPLICQSFQCSGERCYQDKAHANGTVTCHNGTYCELYRYSSTNYTARCSSACGTMCRTNSSVSAQQCALDCCNSLLCLQLNASSYGDLPSTTVPPTTTTTRAPPRNGKVCAAFSCHGDGCFKGKKTVARCIVGHDFCEMKKTGLSYVAGCSKACKAAKPVCAGGMKAACYQECCPATLKASCLKLDGKVHINSAGQVTLVPFLKLVVFGVVVLLNYRVSTSLWG